MWIDVNNYIDGNISVNGPLDSCKGWETGNVMVWNEGYLKHLCGIPLKIWNIYEGQKWCVWMGWKYGGGEKYEDAFVNWPLLHDIIFS